MRVVVLCADGFFQRYLAQRVASRHDLAGIVAHAPQSPKGTLSSRLSRYANPFALARYLSARAGLPAFERDAKALRNQLFCEDGREPEFPAGVPLVRVQDINAAEAVEFVRSLAPDIVVVNGTNLLRRPMLKAAKSVRHGIVNLHTGLSPYTRGGNCNLFAILDGRPELVGVTVHYIDGGIDSGDLILTRRLEIQPGENFEMLDLRTFHEGIELLLAGIDRIAEGTAERVPQWEKGKLYLRRTGYVYEPFHRLCANRKLVDGGLKAYLANRSERDAAVRLVG